MDSIDLHQHKSSLPAGHAAGTHLDVEVASQAGRVVCGCRLRLGRLQRHRVSWLALMPAQHAQHLHVMPRSVL